MFRLSFIAIIVLASCTNASKNKPDVSAIKVSTQLERFEHLFFSIDTNHVAAGLASVYAKSGFTKDFVENILQVRMQDTVANTEVVVRFLRSYRPIYDSIKIKYQEFSSEKAEIEDGFRFVKHYFPDYKIPKLVTFIGTLDAPGMVLTKDHLGIGLHQFGGKNFSVYQDPQVQQMYPAYISRRFDREYIAVNAMKSVADDLYPDNSTAKPLIEQMVEKGKSWYLLDHFLPDAPDSIKTGFTKKQMDWLKENEGNAWSFITSQENLYSIEPHVIQTYIGEAPFTQNMPEASPGNLGQWIGWRIVQAYAAKNEQLTLQQVLATPARKIFEESKYRPK